MREAARDDVRRAHADARERLHGAPVGLAPAEAVAHLEDLRDLAPGAHDRRERGHGVLRDEADEPGPGAPQVGAAEREDVDAADRDRASRDGAAGRQEPGDREREGRLAGARLADHREHAARGEPQRDVAERDARAVAHLEAVDDEHVVRRAAERRSRAHVASVRARGSTSARATSASRLNATTATEPRMIVPMRTGRSSESNASCCSCPIPGQP